MERTELLTGLDIGSGRVTCVIASRNEETGRITVLGGAAADCKGLKNGMVTIIDEAARAIALAIEKAESRAGQVVVSSVLLGIRGPHIYSMDARGRQSIGRSDQEISAEDVASVIENSKAFTLSPGTEIMHVVPQRFSLDHLNGVPNPIGMQGSLLEVETHMVMGSTPAITNILKAVSEAGFHLAEPPIYTPLALGELVLAEEDKNSGALLVDIGGQTTSVAVYSGGAIHFTRELALGGDSITKDLAHGLGTTYGWAKELKEKYGAAYSDMVKKGAAVSVMKADRRTKQDLQPAEFLRYIQPRVEEIFENVYEAVQKSQYTELPGGAILTGGGALLKGMPEAAAELLELPQARLAYPAYDLLDCPEEYLAQPYLGAVALACSPYLRNWDTDLTGPSRRGGQLKRLMRWITDLF